MYQDTRASSRYAKQINPKTPRTYFEEQTDRQTTTRDEPYALMSNDDDVMDSSMDERLIPRAEHARTSASKRGIIGEVDESPLLTSRSAPRTDLKHIKDSLLRMATEPK